MLPPIKTDHDQYLYVQFERDWIIGLLKLVVDDSIVVKGRAAAHGGVGYHTINLAHVVYYTYKTKEEADTLLTKVGLDPL